MRLGSRQDAREETQLLPGNQPADGSANTTSPLAATPQLPRQPRIQPTAPDLGGEPTEPLTPSAPSARDHTTQPSVNGQAPQGDQQPGEPISLAGARAVTIGRAPENDIVLDHEQVSQRHARVTIGKRGVAHLADLGSTNGTYVNGYPVRNARLAPGAEVRIGPYRFVYTGAELVRYDESKSIRIDAIDLQESVHPGVPRRGKRTILLD
ncbi:MAG: FHA domain-containing protein, partial [Ktedonobacterales bacterium]